MNLRTERLAWALFWVCFVLAQAGLVWWGLSAVNKNFYDVSLYQWWATAPSGARPILDVGWVYPALAFVPMKIATLFGASLNGYILAWCSTVVALDALGVWAVAHTGRGSGAEASASRRARRAAWWWLGFCVLLGPLSLGRVDSVVAPIMVIALAIAMTRPALASVLLTAGTWMKIAPVAPLMALFVTARARWRTVVFPAALVSAGVVALVTVLGGGGHVLSFLSQQGSRGLQVESVGGTPLIFGLAASGQPIGVFNDQIITFEIPSPAAATIGTVLDIALVIAIVVIGVLGWRIRGGGSESLAVMSLTLLSALIVFNKVGSPQFTLWLVAPVVCGVARSAREVWWWRVAVTVALIALANHLVFPLLYDAFILGEMSVVLIQVVRNCLVVGVMIAGLVEMWRMGVDDTRDTAAIDPI